MKMFWLSLTKLIIEGGWQSVPQTKYQCLRWAVAKITLTKSPTRTSTSMTSWRYSQGTTHQCLVLTPLKSIDRTTRHKTNGYKQRSKESSSQYQPMLATRMPALQWTARSGISILKKISSERTYQANATAQETNKSLALSLKGKMSPKLPILPINQSNLCTSHRGGRARSLQSKMLFFVVTTVC